MPFESPDAADLQIVHLQDPRPFKPTTRSAAGRRVIQTALAASLMSGGFVAAQEAVSKPAVSNQAVGNQAGGGGGGNEAAQLRQFIDRQVGGINKLKVPATNAAIPVIRQADGTVNPRYKTTEEKRFLGKMLFHDPVRTARVNKGNFGSNEGQPLEFPAGTAFGGNLFAANNNISAIVNSQVKTGSCGSCHIGEAAGKAGQQLNFNTGGEGRGYTDEQGNFFPRRRPQAILPQIRSAPIFAGDLMVDALPTLTDIVKFGGANSLDVVTTPATFFHTPAPTFSSRSGRLDQLDSVGRMSPSMVGAAFNNRLLLGGFAGEPNGEPAPGTINTPGSANPFDDPAQENLTLLLLDAHRMLNFQSAELAKVPAYRYLFTEAFPEEAAAATASGNIGDLINDVTVLRATATFLRTIVTRNTPFDRFLAGDNRALTAAQLRGARLFFTPATDGAGGAGCVSCHSGPMLNKQQNDPDVAGVGRFIEENFINVGIGDHPVQALNALARGRLNPNRVGPDGFPYHAEDTGRQEITGRASDAFKFRSLTLRQLKDGRNFFHSGAFTEVRDVVEYFNAGVPADVTAGAASTLSPRFTNPRGPGYGRGLGLSKPQIDDLVEFLEDGLDDPTLRKYDPKSSTDSLQPNIRDLTFSKYRPALAALGAKDGLMPSGLAIDNNDALGRRDQGLEFLNVTSQLSFWLLDSNRNNGRQSDRYRITNNSTGPVDTHLLLLAKGLPYGAQMTNASGVTDDGDPYLRVFLNEGVLLPGQSIVRTLTFQLPRQNSTRPRYQLDALSGQGKP